MSRKIRIPEPQFAEKRAPENARYSFFAVDGKIVQLIEMPDGTRAHGQPDIERIDVDVAPDGEVAAIVVHADASSPLCSRQEMPDRITTAGVRVGAVLTAEEVAARTRVHPATIRRMARNGEIKAARVGGQWRFAADVVAQLEAQMTGEASHA